MAMMTISRTGMENDLGRLDLDRDTPRLQGAVKIVARCAVDKVVPGDGDRPASKDILQACVEQLKVDGPPAQRVDAFLAPAGLGPSESGRVRWM
jgi:hypothetical protein